MRTSSRQRAASAVAAALTLFAAGACRHAGTPERSDALADDPARPGQASPTTVDASRMQFVPDPGVTRQQATAIQAMVMQVIDETARAGLTLARLPEKVQVMRGTPSSSSRVDGALFGTNASTTIRVSISAQTEELCAAVFAPGIRDAATQRIFQCTQGVSHTDVIAIRDNMNEADKRVADERLKPVRTPTRIMILSGMPTVGSAIDRSRVAADFARVSRTATTAQIASGIYYHGLRDADTQNILIPRDDIELDAVFRLREFLNRAGIRNFQVTIVNGAPRPGENIDATYASRGQIRVSAAVTFEELQAALPR